MNIDFNLIFKRLIPYIYALTLAYLLCTVLVFILPKQGFENLTSSTKLISYNTYSGFYKNFETYSKNEEYSNKALNNEKHYSLKDFKLKAIYASSNTSGWITIKNSSNKSIILKEQEKINNYKLTKFFSSYVLFEKNNKVYKLELPNKNVKSSYEVLSNKNIVVNQNLVQIKREYLNSYINDANKIWENIQIKEYKNSSNTIDGFQIKSINTSSVFEKIGLRSDDIIKAINGLELKSYADAFEVYKKINQLEHLRINIIRNNKELELNYEIN